MMNLIADNAITLPKSLREVGHLRGAHLGQIVKAVDATSHHYELEFGTDSRELDFVAVHDVTYAELPCDVWFVFDGWKQQFLEARTMFFPQPEYMAEAWTIVRDRVSSELGGPPDSHCSPNTAWTVPGLAVEMIEVDSDFFVLAVTLEGDR